MVPTRLLVAPLALVCSLACSANAARAQAPAEAARARFHRAWYLEHEEQRPEEALELYRALAEDPALEESLRVKARGSLAGLRELAAARDLAALVPPETILYAELTRPGARLSELLARLGLLGEEGTLPSEFAISPTLLRAALGLRGAALAVTRLDEQGEPAGGVLVVDPDELELARGLLETALPAEGEAQPPCAGFPVWKLEQGFAMFTRRLVVLATDRAELEGVVARLEGRAASSLALASPLREALPPAPGALLSFYLRGEPLRPWIARALERAAAEDPDARTLRALLDPESLEHALGSLTLEEDGLALELALALREGHASLAFHLLRMPPLDASVFERVPAGAAASLALSLNAPAAVAPALEDGAGRPVATAMDFGRELFGNLVDLALFVLPPASGRLEGLPPVVASVRVNDLERSRALWRFVLALAGGGEGAQAPRALQLGGREAEQWLCRGLPILLVPGEHELLLSPSRAALEQALAARAAGRTLARDAQLGAALEELAPLGSLALLAHGGRVLELVRPRDESLQARRLAALAAALGETTLSLGLRQTPTQLALHAHLGRVPDLSAFVRTALRERKAGARGARVAQERAEHAPAEEPGPVSEAAELAGDAPLRPAAHDPH